MALHQAGRLMEADGYYRQVLDNNPKDKDALRLRGALAYQIGRPEAAAELLAAARKADPKNPEVLTLLGLSLEGSGNPEGAEQAYRKALSLAPKSPEIWNNLGALLRETDRLEKAAEAFGRAVVLKPDYVEAYQNLGATLFRMGKLEAALAAFETGLNVSPDDLDMRLNYGVVLSAAGRMDDAIECFDHILEKAPGDPDTLTNMVGALMRMEELDRAEEIAREALSAAPESPGAMANLAMVLSAGRHFDEAEPLFQDALRAAPDFADVWGNYANMLSAADRLEEAGVAYERARKLAPGDARHAFQLGLWHLNTGDLEKGWRLYESGFDAGERVTVPAPKLPRWDGSPVPGKRILLVPEQGLGDELRSLSCLPDVLEVAGEGTQIVLGCDARLEGLVKRSFPTVQTVARDAVASVKADVACPVASLPGLFRNDLSDFPDKAGYLKADPARVAALEEVLEELGRGIKVGIAWRSGLMRLRSRDALSDIAQWAPVFDVPGVQFVNLQYGDVAEELAGRPVAHVPGLDLLNDLEGAAALTHSCDLVINMGTSVGDMAGALGVPCWTLLRKPEWITLGSEGHPFYPRTEVFWRMPDEDWSTVLHRVAERLDVIKRRWQG